MAIKLFSRSKLFALGLAVIFIILAGALLWYKLQQPSIGVINQTGSKQAAQLTDQNEYTDLIGQNFKLRYQAGYELKESQNNKLYLEQYNLTSVKVKGALSKALSISVRQPTIASLDEESGYVIRKKDPSQYTYKEQVIGNEKVVTFLNTASGYEQTAFWLHQNKILSLSLASNNSQVAELEAEFNAILNSIEWL